jgi:hypothetical protein
VRLVAHRLESRPRTEGADFGICQTFAASPAEPGELPCWFSEKISRRILSGGQGMIVWWSIGAGVHVEPHSHPNEQIV